MKIVVDDLPLTAERCKFAYPSPLTWAYFCSLKGKAKGRNHICDRDCARECEELITLNDLLSSRR